MGSSADIDRHIEEAFEKAEYKKLSGLLKRAPPDSYVAAFYRGILAEHGLQGNIDLQAAKDHYEEAFDSGYGLSKAGNYLARIYQKEGKPNKAKALYAKLLSLPRYEVEFAYAAYRLARMATTEEAPDAKNKYDAAIEIYAKLAPDSRAYAKVLYHKGKLLLQQKNITEAKKLFRDSRERGYKLAEAEICNIEARSLPINDALKKYEQALRIDPGNIDARIGKAENLIKSSKDIDQDKARELIQEVLQLDPENGQAKKYLAFLKINLARTISSSIADNLRKNTKELDSKSYQQFGFTRVQDFSEQREGLIQALSQAIPSLLNQNKYIKDKASFKDKEEIARNITQHILTNSLDTMRKIVQEDRQDLLEQLKQETSLSIDTYAQSKQPKAPAPPKQPEEAPIPQDHVNPLEIRQAFEAQVAAKLFEVYNAVHSLEKPEQIDYTELEAGRLNGRKLPLAAAFLGPTKGGFLIEFANTALSYSGKILPIASSILLGPIGKSISGAVGSVAVTEMQKQSNGWKKTAASKAVKDFSQIGKNPAEAKKHFQEVAKKLVDSYGMQIDRLDRNGVEKLSNTAVERMLCHMNDKASYGTMRDVSKVSSDVGIAAKAILDNPGINLVRFLTGKKAKKQTPDELLLEGAIQGQSRTKRTLHADGGQISINWDADEVFTKPAITNNGTDLYCDAASDPSKYGARKELRIPDTHRHNQDREGKYAISPVLRTRIKENFRVHSERLDLQYNSTDQTKTAHHSQEESIIQEDFNQRRKEYTLQGRLSWFKILAGAGSLLFANTSITAALSGLPAASVIPLAATLGVTSAAVLPIGIAFAAVGAILMVRGSIGAYYSSQNKMKLLDIQKNAPKNLANQRAKQQQKALSITIAPEQAVSSPPIKTTDSLEQRRANYTAKVKKNTKYTSHAEKERDKNPKPKKTMADITKERRAVTALQRLVRKRKEAKQAAFPLKE
jgi:hypothetical protein